MRVLSLFSGGGLGDYGLTLAGMEIVGQVEWDKYCQKILKLRWPEVPKWEDVRDVTGEQVREKCGTVDLIAGGFPCQPFSSAGKKKGEADERNMWPAMYRIISEVKPAWVLAENVRGIVKPYLDTVLSDLEGLGYSCLPLLIPASAVGAPHRRERLWILGYSELHGQSAAKNSGRFNPGSDLGKGTQGQESTGEPEGSGHGARGGENVADTKERGCGRWTDSGEERRERMVSGEQSRGSMGGKVEGCGRKRGENVCNPPSEGFQNGADIQMGEPKPLTEPERSNWWTVEPNVGRVANGVANRVDRLKLLGNGQVVQVVEWIGRMILEFDNVSELF